MFKGMDFVALQMPSLMIGFSYHDEHRDSGYHCLEIFLGVFAVGIHFGRD